MLLLLALLLVAWLVARNRRESAASSADRQTKPGAARDTTYHAVSIWYAADACEAAKSLAGRRFLASAAPRLPLPECDAKGCECRFSHHDDRRSGRDRRSPFQRAAGPEGTGSFKEELREGRDRRRDADDHLL
jgi:hypothetical protein